MKLISMMIIALFTEISLSACGSNAPAPSQPAISAGSPDTAEAYLLRGDQYFEIKDYDPAILDYSQAIKLKADFSEAYNNRGLAYALKGKTEMANAIADYSQAIQLRPDYVYAINNRGVAYMASGHPEEALHDFNHAIQLQPDFPQAHGNRGNYYFRVKRYDLAIIDFYYAQKIPLILTALLCIVLLLIVMIIIREARRRVFDKRNGENGQ